jgi:hypothetical protein
MTSHTPTLQKNKEKKKGKKRNKKKKKLLPLEKSYLEDILLSPLIKND